MQETTMTPELARSLIQLVNGDGQPRMATAMPQGGDVAVVLKAGGGVEILSVMADNPDQAAMEELGMRGTVALALFALLSNEALMTQVLAETVARVEVHTPTAH